MTPGEYADAAAPPRLEGDRVRLRPIGPQDAVRVMEAYNDAECRRWLRGRPVPFTLADAHAEITEAVRQAAAGKRLTWAVTGRKDDLLLARLAVFGMEDGCGEVGYWSHPDARGRGLVVEMLRVGVAHAFAPRAAGGLGLWALRGHAAAGNAASCRVLERVGFVEVGRALDYDLADGTWVEGVSYRLAGPPAG